MVAGAIECFDESVIARVLHENRRRGVGASATVDVIGPVDAAVVENYGDDRQMVAADGLDFHSAEAERAVAFDRDHRMATYHGRANGITHADAHHPPSPAVQTFARFV